MSDAKAASIPRGRLNRLGRIVGMTAKVSSSIVQARVGKTLTGRDTSDEAAKRIFSTLGEMKGAALKIGQTLSLGTSHLPAEIRDVVSQLFSQAPGLAYGEITEVFVEELGAPPEKVFASFEKKPFAAASLGQVHRATLRDGTTVAVKIQYPGVADAMAQDLQNIGTLVKTLGVGTNIFDGKAYFREVSDELEYELDYARELELLEEYTRFLEPWDDLIAPKAYPAYCTPRVLTLEYIEGITVHEYVSKHDPAGSSEANRIGDQLIRAVYGPFFQQGIIHADTHPGNFIVCADGRLGVLDFGSVKRFSDHFVGSLYHAVELGLAGDTAGLLEIMKAGRFSVNLSDDKARAMLRDISDIVVRPLVGPYNFAEDKIVEDIRALSSTRASEFLRVRPPAEGLLFFRSITGLTHNLRQLGTSGNWRRFFEEMLADARRRLPTAFDA